MSEPSSPGHKSVSREDSSVSDPRSEPAVETDRFGFLLSNGPTAGSVGPPPELVRQREAKWIDIISQWDHFLQKKNNKVKEQCQKGIPASLRAKCWPLLCGATEYMKNNENLYQSLDSMPALPSWVEVIERDLDRQFPFHEMFHSKDGHGQRGLFRVLKAYTQYQPVEGYCQAQGPVAAVLLMNLPAEEAFWCLVQISEQYLPGYYTQLLEGVLFDASMLSWVLKRMCLPAHRHLQRYGVEPLMFATDWLMCLFTRHLPFNTLLRVWDLFFCYGVRVLFQVAVVLVRRVLGRAEQRQECSGQMETLERLRAVREILGQEDDTSFMAEVCSVPLSSSDLKRRTEKELEKWRQDRPTSTFDPRGRCHGYWASGTASRGEQGQKGGSKVDLSIPLVRSASTLSLSTLRGGKRSAAVKVERNFSMGTRGVGRESWAAAGPPRGKAGRLRGTRVQEEEEDPPRETLGKPQSCVDAELMQPFKVKQRLQVVTEPQEVKVKEGKEPSCQGIGQLGLRTGEDSLGKERQMEDSQGGLLMVQEVSQHHSLINEGAVGVGATQSSALNRTLQPGKQEKDLKDDNQSQVPEEHDLKHNNQSQVPEELDLKHNNQSQVPEELDLKHNNQSQVPEEQDLEHKNQSRVPEEQDLKHNQSQVPEEQDLKHNNQSEVPEEHDLKHNNQSQVPEEQDLKHNNQSQVPEKQDLEHNNQSEVPEEHDLKHNNQSQVPEEQDLKHNNQSQVPEEHDLKQNNQSQVPEEHDLKHNNQSQVPEELDLKHNNQSQVPEEYDLKQNNQSQVPEEHDLKQNNQSQVPEEQDLEHNNQSEVPEEHDLKHNNQSQVPEEQDLKHNNQSQVPEELDLKPNNQTQVPETLDLKHNNQSQVPEEHDLKDNNRSWVLEEQKYNGKPNQKEEVAEKQRVKTLYQIAKLAAQCGNLVASQVHTRETTTDTNADTETQAVVDTTEEQLDATPELETVTVVTENGQAIAMHVDTGTTPECECAVRRRTQESTARRGPDVMKETDQGSQEVTDTEEERTEKEARPTNTQSMQKQTSVSTETESGGDGEKPDPFKNETFEKNPLPLHQVGVLMQRGVERIEETRAEGDFVVSTMTVTLADTTVVTGLSADICDAAKVSLTDEVRAKKEAICLGHTQAKVSDTNAETVEDDDTITCNQTALIEVNPPLTTEEPAVQVSASKMEERIENVKETVDSAEVIFNPHQHHTVDSGASGTAPQVQDAPLPSVMGPAVVPCIPVSAPPVGHQSSTPPGDFRVRKSSSSHGSRLVRRLSKDIFTAPQITPVTSEQNPGRPPLTTAPGQTCPDATPPAARGLREGPPATPEPSKRPGLFSRLRAGYPNHGRDRKAEATPQKAQVIPKIVLQDFSSGVGEERPLQEAEEAKEPLSSKERRRRRRDRERKEREEEKARKRLEKELKKEGREKGRKGSQRRTAECPAGEPGSVSGAQERYSSPYTDTYF